jgi:serine/threonine protein kinase
MNDNEENEDKPLISQFIINQGFNLKEQIGSGHFSKVFLATYNEGKYLSAIPDYFSGGYSSGSLNYLSSGPFEVS